MKCDECGVEIDGQDQHWPHESDCDGEDCTCDWPTCADCCPDCGDDAA